MAQWDQACLVRLESLRCPGKEPTPTTKSAGPCPTLGRGARCGVLMTTGSLGSWFPVPVLSWPPWISCTPLPQEDLSSSAKHPPFHTVL